MADTQQPIGGNLADSIAMLEQILEVMPQDSDALRALYSAYRKGGQPDRAFDYLSRMVDVALGGGEPELLTYAREQLSDFEETHPSEVAAQLARLRALAVEEEPQTPATAPEQQDGKGVAAKTEADISEELALAWRLYEENQLSQEEYSSVLHDLTEVSSKELDVPVSVLHVLNDRGFNQMARIMNYMSNRAGVPYLSLSNFELAENVATVLPEGIPVHEGALPFAFFGNDLLVGVLNPFNNMLVDKVETESGHRCHTYLVEPEDYDMALGKLRSLAASA
ncbi:MAG: hypothetical protein U9P12_08755 [Verrucomicrobiota bacterium]|nr:hypothetical protein [Verrucomicrobiota bacterium]